MFPYWELFIFLQVRIIAKKTLRDFWRLNFQHWIGACVSFAHVKTKERTQRTYFPADRTRSDFTFHHFGNPCANELKLGVNN